MKRAVLPLCVCMVLAAGGCYNPTFDSEVTSLSLNTESVELYLEQDENGTYVGTFDLEASLRPYIAENELIWWDGSHNPYPDGAPDRTQIDWKAYSFYYDPNEDKYTDNYTLDFIRYQGGFSQGRAWVKMMVQPHAPISPGASDTFGVEGKIQTKDGRVFMAWVKVTVMNESQP